MYILITGMAILPVGAEEREDLDHVTDMSVFEKARGDKIKISEVCKEEIKKGRKQKEMMETRFELARFPTTEFRC